MQSLCQLHPNFCKKRKKISFKKNTEPGKTGQRGVLQVWSFRRKKLYTCAWQQDTELKNHMFSWGELGLPELADYEA